MDSALKLENIEKEYGTTYKNKVLFGVDLDIKKGEFCTIIGQVADKSSDRGGVLRKRSSSTTELQRNRKQ